MPVLNILWADADGLTFSSDELISDYRREKLETIKPDQARRRSLCAELLLNEAVRRVAPDCPIPLDIMTDANGKPHLTALEYEFSLSHTAHFAACALSDAPIGLDIQILTKHGEQLVRRFFTQEEQELIFSSKDRDAAFTRLWCRKESFLKAIGLGLRLPLDSFDVSDDHSAPVYHDITYGFREYRSGDLFFCVCEPVGLLPEEIKPELIKLS